MAYFSMPYPQTEPLLSLPYRVSLGCREEVILLINRKPHGILQPGYHSEDTAIDIGLLLIYSLQFSVYSLVSRHPL